MLEKVWRVDLMWDHLNVWPSRAMRKLAKYFSRQAYTNHRPFDIVDNCCTETDLKQVVVCDLEGTLLISRSSFSYFMLLAFDADSALRAFFLLLIWPLAWLSYHLMSESLALQILIFVTFVGMKDSAIEGASQAVLPKFFLEDMHPKTLKILNACGKRCVITAMPRIMVEPFLKDYLSVDHVLGSEVQLTSGGRFTGFLKSPGVLVGAQKLEAVRKSFAMKSPDIGIGDCSTDHPFLAFCKKAYIVVESKTVLPVPKENYPKPLIFHDGRLAIRPTPAITLALFLWMPMGIVLAISRIALGLFVPLGWSYPIEALLGVTLRVKGSPPAPAEAAQHKKLGILFVCSHRTLLDPIFVSIALRRHVTAVTYSISRLTEALSPIRTVRLTRCRLQDAKQMKSLLEEGDLVICPEGTTCREPYLLRFSSLFAELADHIVPVTINIKHSVFHGTTARGWKGMDALFFFMNPSPSYYIEFMEELPVELTCAGGKSSFEVANYIQKQLARSLGFQCTNLTRKDKYRILAGHDGSHAPVDSQQEEQDQRNGKVTKAVNHNMFTTWKPR
ncbi:hypothetical protein O6H91_19G020200 [Diphasiastrum complanatum]|uniref:Uncharacterized protein n=1 Tax=Diphasiastrum complanatum TaxID=34168 RepID=A0ACC2AT73_DIPCM|nr:hypothetical protein O6H91_Y351600 [Diphasiastrum complanatum]KAJ7520735.1 hypothetical protein O6H91_19G020200 [Diphasiastrum complanatum]